MGRPRDAQTSKKEAHLALHGSYTHFYKTPSPSLVQEPFPLDTLYARLAITWNKVISDVAQSFSPRQEIRIASYIFIFDAELCLIKLTPLTCFLVPYTLLPASLTCVQPGSLSTAMHSSITGNILVIFF